MKINLTIISLIAIFFITGCKKNDFEGIDKVTKAEGLTTLNDFIDEKNLDLNSSITQFSKSNNNVRELIKFQSQNNSSPHKYLLVENNKDNKSQLKKNCFKRRKY
jgi:hypothetical protein